MEWQLIEKAPTDGTVVLAKGFHDQSQRAKMPPRAVRFDSSLGIGIWWMDNNGYGFNVQCYPTHFMRLPE